jgi:transcriptional regulator with XRE-family HTH domain
VQPSHAELAARLRAHLVRIVARGDITQQEIADRTRYSQPHIANVLGGHRRMSPEMADSLRQATGTRLADLFAGEELRQIVRWTLEQCEQ